MSTVLERLETRMQAFSRRHNKTGIVSSCVAEPNVHSHRAHGRALAGATTSSLRCDT